MSGKLLKSASSTALFAALGLIALGAAAPAAKAADLGGDCCSDLEERVAELEATTARKGNRRVSLTISGQVHTGVMAWDNGEKSDVYVGDIPNLAGTFVQFNGSAKISSTLSAGFLVQVAVGKGARFNEVSEIDDDGADAAGVGTGDTQALVTLANWYLDHKQLGRLTVGRINTATGGITAIDLGGIGAAASANIGFYNRSFSAVGTGFNWTDLLGGTSVNGSIASRANAVSYTTPTVGGFSLQAAWGENDVWDAALRYAGEFSGFRIAAGIGYISNSGGLNEVIADIPANEGIDGPAQWKGSASILHVPTGLFVNGAYINQDLGSLSSKETTLWLVQGGIAKNWTGLGKTVLYGEYAKVEDSLLKPDYKAQTFSGFGEGELWGLGVVQHIDAAAMELFLSYRNFSGEANPTGGATQTAKDFDAVLGGARIKF